MFESSLRRVSNAVLRPTQSGERFGIAQKCGIFDSGGTLIQEMIDIARVGRLTEPCPCPDTTGLTIRKGRWLYGGIAYNHFGLALIFSTARLWALKTSADQYDGILFLAKDPAEETRAGTTRNLQAILRAFGVPLPTFTVSQSEIVEELDVPSQGVSTAPELISGTEAYRAFIHDVMRKRTDPSRRARRLYVSRRKLPALKSRFLFEKRLESYLGDQGYEVLHPQRHSVDAQIEAYRSASQIISMDCSALHLAAFSAKPDAHVAILARRGFFAEALAQQFASFGGAQAQAIYPCSRYFAPSSARGTDHLWFQTVGELDFELLENQLAKLGFLEAATGWSSPDASRVARRLRRFSKRSKADYVQISDQECAAEFQPY